MADKPQISKIHEHVLKNQKIDGDVVPSSLDGSKPGFLKWLLKPPKILAVATAALVITVGANQVIDNQPAQSPPHPISQPPVEQLPQSSPNDYWENLFNQFEDSILSVMLQPVSKTIPGASEIMEKILVIKKKWQESNAEARTQMQNETKCLQAIAFELQKYNQLLDPSNMDGSYDYNKAVKGRIETIVEAFGKC